MLSSLAFTKKIYTKNKIANQSLGNEFKINNKISTDYKYSLKNIQKVCNTILKCILYKCLNTDVGKRFTGKFTKKKLTFCILKLYKLNKLHPKRQSVHKILQ